MSANETRALSNQIVLPEDYNNLFNERDRLRLERDVLLVTLTTLCVFVKAVSTDSIADEALRNLARKRAQEGITAIAVVKRGRK